MCKIIEEHGEYKVYATYDLDMPGKYFISYREDYLSVDGTISHNASNGWFKTLKEVHDLLIKIAEPSLKEDIIGGE